MKIAKNSFDATVLPLQLQSCENMMQSIAAMKSNRMHFMQHDAPNSKPFHYAVFSTRMAGRCMSRKRMEWLRALKAFTANLRKRKGKRLRLRYSCLMPLASEQLALGLLVSTDLGRRA